jgi:hypothetical protein
MTKQCKGCGSKFYTNNNLKDRCKKCERSKLREQIELSTFAATLDNEIGENKDCYMKGGSKKRMKKMKGYKKLGEARVSGLPPESESEKKTSKTKKMAKELFNNLIDPDILEGGIDNLDDNLDDPMYDSNREEVKKIILGYIKTVKTCIKNL